MNLIKKIVAILTVLTVFSMVGSPVLAVTAEELQAQINALLAQLSTLQTQLATLQGTTPTVTGCTITSFDRNLKQGMSGDDVKCLQIILNSATDTQVATTGAGSPGSETTYFGSLTKAAVIKFQEKYAADCLTPLGLTKGTGYVGAKTRAKLNTLIGVTPPPTGCTTDADCAAGYMCSAGVCVLKPVTGTGLTVALASDTPAAGTVVTTQGLAPLAKFTFTNGDSAEVKVTVLKLKRIGVSADASLSNVYLFDGALRLTDAASVSSGVITFTDTAGIFKIAAGGSKTITVSSDLSASAGETLGVAINAATDVVSTASAVNGTFPINGNLMSVASATLAGVYFNGTTTPTVSGAAVSVDPQNDYVVWENIATVATRAVTLNRIALREVGSVNYSDLQNFRLYIDGVQIGSAVASLDSNGYVTFDLAASPKRLEAGSRDIKVLADIIGGSSRTFSFSLKVSADANFTDTQYGLNVLPTVTNSSTAFTARNSCTDGTYYCTIAAGTLTITKATDSPANNVVNGASAVTLAKFTLKAAGEKVKVESLRVAAIVETSASADDTDVTGLRNGMILANGVQIGSTATLTRNVLSGTTPTTTGYTTYNFGSSLIVEPGSPVTLTVIADVYDSDATNNVGSGDIIQALIVGGSSNAQGMVSSTTLSIPAANSVNTLGNQLTVAVGGVSLAKYTAYTNQSFVVPLTEAKLAHFTLTANTTEAVNLNSIVVDWDTVTGAFDASDDLSNLYVKYGTATSTVKQTVADTGNTWSVNYQIPAGGTIDLIVYADVASTAYSASTTNYGIASMTTTGTTVSSATAANGSEIAGQTTAFVAGTFTAKKDAGTPVAQIVAGNQTVTAAKFKFESSYETYTIKELWFSVSSTAASGAIINAVLKDGDTVLATRPFDTTKSTANDTAYFTGLNVVVPANTSKVLTVALALSTPSATAGTSQQNVAITLWKDKYADSQGVQYTDNSPEDSYAAHSADNGADPAGNAMYVLASIPTFTDSAISTTQGSALSAGSAVTLYKFKVTADSQGPIALKQLKFTVTVTDGGTDTTPVLNTFKFYRGSTDLTTSYVTIQDATGTSLEATAANVAEGAQTAPNVIVTFDAEEEIPAGTTYEYSLKATPSGFATSNTGNDSVSTVINYDTSSSSDSSLFYVYDPSGTGSIHQLATAAAGTGATAENIIWSDVSALSHSYTSGSSTADWANSYLVLNLPLDSAGIVAQ